MNAREYVAALSNRWLIIVATTMVGTIAALTYSLVSPPVYEASTRFFVSTSANTASDVYQSNLASQQRVASYTELLTGRELAKRVVDALSLAMPPEQLIAKVVASSKPNTVLIDATVSDRSPDTARDIANAIGDEFPTLVGELETPPDGGTASATVSVAEAAETPSAPTSPKTMRNILLGLTVGFLVGVVGALVRDRLDNTVKDKAVLEEITDSVLIGSIPLDKKVRDKPSIDFRQSTTPTAEAFREMRMNLRFLAVDDPPRLLLVTSAIAGEGKSTTSVNLALALAEMGHRVALVDADLRRPSISRYLGTVGSVGVSSVLSREVTIDEVVQESGFENVWVVASGPTPPNPGELLGSAAARAVLTDLKKAFDFVVVDSPPLLPVTDASVLATECDGTILVTRHGHTRREDVARAASKLENVGAALLGVVLTMAPGFGRSVYHYGNDVERARPESVRPEPVHPEQTRYAPAVATSSASHRQ